MAGCCGLKAPFRVGGYFGKALRENKLDVPEDIPLPGAQHLGLMPHVFVGDVAFSLRKA